MDLPGEFGLTLTAYTAEPGTPSHDALTLLSSWAATTEVEIKTNTADRDQHTS